MIVKYFELKKINLKEKKFFLLYGNNNGLIEDVINKNLKPNLSSNIKTYDEQEIIENSDVFKEEILNKFRYIAHLRCWTMLCSYSSQVMLYANKS